MRKLRNAIEYDSPTDAVRFSEFGMAVSEVGADFVRVLFSCLVLAIASTVVLALAGKELQQYVRTIALISSIPLLLLAAAVLLRSTFPLLNALAELISDQDLDGSGAIGDIPLPAPAPDPVPERIITIRPRGTQIPSQDPPSIIPSFEDFIRGCEFDTTAARWENVLGRERYRAWRDKLIEGGWAEWKGKDRNRGWKLSVPAEHILEAVHEFSEIARKFA